MQNIYHLKSSDKRYLTERQLKQNKKTLEGVVVNNFYKDTSDSEAPNMDDTYNALLISENTKDKFVSKEKNESFDTKKPVLPLVLGAAAVFSSSILLSYLMKKSAIKTTKEPFKNRLQPLGINVNIKQEPEFSAYMALRDPNVTNILAMGAVFAFSAITLVAKKFVEGMREIWVKKQEADTRKDLQEKLIEVETKSFSGKLDVIRQMLSQKGEYFKKTLDIQNSKDSNVVFKNFFNFKGMEPQKEEEKDQKPKLINRYTLAAAGTIIAGIIAGTISIKNFKESTRILKNFEDSFVSKKQQILDEILKSKDINRKNELADVLKKMGVDFQTAKKFGSEITLSGKELDEFANDVAVDVNTLWGSAPTGMSVENGKSFFYCYLDQPRGHLYNAMIHKENPFLQFLWVAMSLVCGTSFLAKEASDGLKEAAVIKENAKTELSLQQRLVDVEINNFKAKKESAVQPLIEEFERQRQAGKSSAELKVMADNILFEIKNGPPFVYS